MATIGKTTKLPIGSLLLLTGLLFYYAIFYSYQFILIEQTQLFLFTGDFFASFMQKAGGFSEYIAAFCIQFYYIRIVGAIILFLIAVTGWLLINRLLTPFRFKPFTPFHPSILYIALFWLLHTYIDYPLYKSVGFILVCLLGVAYIQIKLHRGRIILGMIFAVFSWYLCKEAAFILLFYILSYEKTIDGYPHRKVYLACVSLIFLVTPFLLRPILNPFTVEEIFGWQNMNQNWAIGYCLLYGLLPFFILWSVITGKQGLLSVIATTTSIVIVYIGCAKTANYKLEALQEMDWLSTQGRWDTIIEKTKKQKTTNIEFLNYYHMALAKNGKMNDDLFELGFPLTNALIYSDATSYAGKTRLSNLYWETGCFRTSQLYSTEAIALLESGANTFHLKRLAIIHMIYNETALAEKYLRMLKKTVCCSKWAVKQLNNIQDNQLLDQVDYIREKRELLPTHDFTIKTNLPAFNIEELYFQRPQYAITSQYTYAFMLLQKRLSSFYTVVSLLQLKQMSEIMQEAILIYEYSKQIPEGQRLKINYSPNVLSRYQLYTQLLKSSTLINTMPPGQYEFKKSYFYYYAFINDKE